MSPPLSKPQSSILIPSKQPLPPLCTLIFLLVLSILAFYAFHHQIPTTNTLQTTHLFLSSSSNSTLSSYLRRLTLHPHLAGTPPSLDTANFVRSHFADLGLETHVSDYKTLLSYPIRASLSAHFSDGSSLDFRLTEENVKPDVVFPYHAYSPSGAVYDRVVYVNYGRQEDYSALSALGVYVKGCVVLARKGGGLSRGVVVKIAEAKGAHAVLIYAEVDRIRGGANVGLERGTVMRGIGDPLSPGWASVDGGERLGLEDEEVLERFPKIPSLPLSFENADVILRSLGGPLVPPEWKSKSSGSRVWRVGPGPTVVNFTYQGERKMVGIQNIFAVVRGLEEPDRFVILGNHRDAWTYGAVDPSSGTAALLDIARRFTLLMQKGWVPRRTIILSSWDAEEFGIVGSTEWVEQNLVNLGANAVAYLNVDCAIQGPGFFAAATPQLDNLLLDVTKKVKDPEIEGATVYDNWVATNQVVNIQRLNAAYSDFAPFLQHAGVPSVDLYYGNDFPVYHTAFDSYEWMIRFADPCFHHHVAVADMWGLLALHLADDSILPFNYLSYAAQLKVSTDVLKNLLDQTVSVDPLINSIDEFASAAKEVENEAKKLREQESRGDFVALKLRSLNDRLMLAERGFLDTDGLQGQRWFKHLIYGPTANYESKMDFFPGVANAAMSETRSTSEREKQAAGTQHEIWRVARAIERASRALKGQLT